MDQIILKDLEGIRRRLSALEDSPALRVVRKASGGAGAGGADITVTTAAELPAIPTSGIQFVLLTDDTVYWAVPGNTDWAPLGGRFGLTDGSVGASAP